MKIAHELAGVVLVAVEDQHEKMALAEVGSTEVAGDEFTGQWSVTANVLRDGYLQRVAVAAFASESLANDCARRINEPVAVT